MSSRENPSSVRELWLNDSLDTVTVKTLPTLGPRLAVGAAIAILATYSLGWALGGAWFVANVTAEIGTWFASGPQRRHGAQSKRQRAFYLASVVWMNCVWSSLAILFWTTNDPALRVCAVSLFACQMLHASIFNAQSNALLLAVGGIPAASLVGVSLFASADLGRFGFTVAAGAALMIAYLTKAVLVSRVNAAALESSSAEAIAANKAKSEFLALMSHELRTPMTGVIGMAQALAAQPMPDGQRRQVDILIKSGDALLGLVNDILDLSKVEAGKLDLERAPFDLAASVDLIDNLWRGVADAKGLALDCRAEVDQSAGSWVIGDEARLRQVMTNLVSNALKFTQSGGVSLTAKLGRPDPDGLANFTLTVADTGIGMSQGQIEGLFRAFTQADASVTRRFGGTGLGLAICRRLVTAMGGDIHVRSAMGEGSTFTVTLELPITAAAPLERDAAAVIDLDGVRILFADDNEVNRLVAKTLLEAFGCVVATVDDGDKAIGYLASAAVDVVLLDVHMPRMGGLEALRRIRADGLIAPGAPIIALTADVLPGQVSRLLAAGFAEVEAKPIVAQRLAKVIAAALGAGDSPNRAAPERVQLPAA